MDTKENAKIAVEIMILMLVYALLVAAVAYFIINMKLKESKENIDENENYILELTNRLDEQEAYIKDLQESIAVTSGIVDQLYLDLEFTRDEVESLKVYLEIVKDNGYSLPRILTKSLGVCYYNNHLETYYNLPMENVVAIARQRLAGYSDAEYWIRNDGVKMLGSYIMASADYISYPYGTIVETSLGEAIIVDTGVDSANKIDIAVNW